MYPRLWGLSGISLPHLVSRLVKHALERQVAHRKLDAGIKAFVASLMAKA